MWSSCYRVTFIILKDKYIVFAAGTDGNFLLVKYRNLSFSFKFTNQSYLFLYTPDHYIKQEMVCRKSFIMLDIMRREKVSDAVSNTLSTMNFEISFSEREKWRVYFYQLSRVFLHSFRLYSGSHNSGLSINLMYVEFLIKNRDSVRRLLVLSKSRFWSFKNCLLKHFNSHFEFPFWPILISIYTQWAAYLIFRVSFSLLN